jgi:xanthine dehydrogenase large subunit
MLAQCVLSALGAAIAATAPDRRAFPPLDAPATPEAILRAIAAHRA